MMRAPDTPPAGLVAVPVGTGCILLLTEPEYVAGIKRGKRWRRALSLRRRSKPSTTGSHQDSGPVEIDHQEGA